MTLTWLWLAVGACAAGGCATIRVTNPPRTADEEYLITQAAQKSVGQLSLDALRDRSVWVESSYAFSTTQPFEQSFFKAEVRQPTFEEAFVIAEIRAKLLKAGVRLAQERDAAQVILEVRIGGLSINREEFLLGIPATVVPGAAGAVTLATPELAILKRTTQQGYASIAYVAYWADTGELLTLSGPYVGHTFRRDIWIFGTGPNTSGDIPPAQPQ
jgi:hypothetical protein